MLPAKQAYFAVRTTIFLPPYWTLNLIESWGKSEKDSKGEVDGLKWRRKWGRGGQHPRCFNGHDQRTSGLSSKKKNLPNKKHIIVMQFSADNSLRQPHQRRTSFGFLLVSQKSTLNMKTLTWSLGDLLFVFGAFTGTQSRFQQRRIPDFVTAIKIKYNKATIRGGCLKNKDP